MRFMFYNCKRFNSDISQWDTNNVDGMKEMFYGCEMFNQDLTNWNVERVNSNTFDNMFD